MNDDISEILNKITTQTIGQMNRAYTNAFSEAIDYGYGYIKITYVDNILEITSPSYDEIEEIVCHD